MHVTYRSYLTAGVAALGAGAIALTPVQPVSSHLAASEEQAVSTLAVNLASSIDPITPWVDTFKLAAQNSKALWDYYIEQPLPLLHTIGANIGTYIKALPDVQFIADSIKTNINTFFYAPWSPGPGCNDQPSPCLLGGDYISNVPITNKVPFLGELSQQQLYGLLPQVLAGIDPDLLAKLAPLLEVSANHWSGELAGLVGTLLAPVVQLTRSFTAIGDYFKEGDVIGAINELINIPANVTNAVLNGAGYFDLTGVVNAIQPLPPEIQSIGLNLGGLISPPVPLEGTVAVPTAVNGGVIFDSIAMAAEALGFHIETPGLQVGWFGSVIGLGQFLGHAMVITPPAPGATVAAAAAAPKAAAAVAAAPVAASAPAVVEAPAAVEAVAPAEAPAETPAPAEEPVVAEVVPEEAPAPAPVEAPALQTVSAPGGQQAASVDNGDNAGGGRTQHSGARGKHAA